MTLIEKLESLPRWELGEHINGWDSDMHQDELGEYIKYNDLLAIINQHKSECEPVGYVSEGSLQSIESGRDGVVGAKSNLRVHPLYTTPPDQSARIAQLEAQRDRLLDALNAYDTQAQILTRLWQKSRQENE